MDEKPKPILTDTQVKQYLSDLPKSAILTFVSFIVMIVFPPLGIVLMTRWNKFARLKVVSYVLVGFLAVWLLFICQMLREAYVDSSPAPGATPELITENKPIEVDKSSTSSEGNV